MALKKNDIIELDITGTSHDGKGIGREDDFVVFVPRSAEGDRIRAKIIYVKKHLASAKLLEVLSPSPSRIPSDCNVFGLCGGCAFRHISYPEELRIKYLRVSDALRKIGHINITPEEILGSENITGYRNKAQYPVQIQGNKMAAGFYAPSSHRLVNARRCLLQPESFERALAAFAEWAEEGGITSYNEITGDGLLRHIYLRTAHATGELMACAVINGEDIPGKEKLVSSILKNVPETKGIILNINKKPGNTILGEKCVTIWGSGTITDIFCGLKIKISPLSFYQVNSRQAELLYGIAADFAGLSGNETLLDLYCGAGTIGLSMAKTAKKIIGVEIVGDAVEDARQNAFINGIENAEFICSDAEKAASMLAENGTLPDVVVVDPPRRGLTPLTIAAVVRMRPDKIVYVSCDPATLARDLSIFNENGYQCKRVKPVDMFPRTSHVECVALMSRV